MAAQLLSTGKMQVNNLTSKAGKQYNAIFYMEPGEQYVNFRMEFAPRTVQSSAPSQSENSPVQSDIQPDKKEATQP